MASTTTAVTTTAYDNVFTFGFGDDTPAAGKVVIQNLDLPRVTHKVNTADRAELTSGQKCGDAVDTATDTVICRDGPDANPKTIDYTTGTITVVAVHQSSGLTDSDDAYQVKAFNGNSIQVSFTPATGGTFATIKKVNVDNGRPILVSTSPEAGLIVKGNTDITFSADITDGGAGFDSAFSNLVDGNERGIKNDLSPSGLLNTETDTVNNVTKEGGVRLVVAGNVVSLVEGDFTKIDGGWRVTKTLNSTAIQSIGPNVPWFFETRDRANNSQRTSGVISRSAGADSGAGPVTTGDARDAVIVDSKFEGSLDGMAFLGSSIRVSRKDGGTTVVSNAQRVTGFAAASGTFTILNSAADPLFKDAVATRQDNQDPPQPIAATVGFQCPFDARDTITLAADGLSVPAVSMKGEDDAEEADQLTACDPKAKDAYEILGSNLLTIDSKSPRLQDGGVTTGIVYNATKKTAVQGIGGKANSIQVKFADDGRNDDDNTGSGLDADSVTPSAFTVAGSTVSSVLPVGNTVYLTLEENLASDERPTVSIASGVIMDKAGNAFGGTRVDKATDGVGPNLSLSEDADLSNSKITITISADEQLGALPKVDLGRVMNKDGDVVNDGDMQCVYAEVEGDADADPPVTGLPEVEGPITPGEGDEAATCAARTGYLPTTPSQVPGLPATQPNPTQATALSFSYGVTPSAVNPSGETGGKYNVYVVGHDTNDEANKSKAGHKSDANNSAAFTFQLDTVLNDGGAPEVTVSDETAMADASDAPDVEAISPMIVTVDWAGEGKEYDGDSYKKVTLTSAKLKIVFSDGSSESRTFDLTTEVDTQNSIKYTIPMLNPKVGAYTLTVQGEDAAGNVRLDGTGTTVQSLSATWNVVAAKPVSIELKPGWNLISLPFQPSNPAINSVIPADHPIGLVMTYDSAQGVWLFSRRDAETGLFTGDVAAMTATAAYFVNTESFEALKLFRPPIATAVAAPAQPPAITVRAGWNLVPVASTGVPTPKGQDADTYFGTLGASWLRALAWDPLARTWIAVSRDQTIHTFEATPEDDYEDRCGTTHDHVAPTTGSGGGTVKTAVGAQVCVGEGLWLWVTEDGTLIPG